MGPANQANFHRETAGDAPDGGRVFTVDLPLRCVFVAAQVATVLLTWRVWEARSHPPMLPLLDLPAVHAGWPMLASLAVVLGWPRVGVPLHTLVLGLAIVADQSRTQPHVISLATLLWGTIGLPGGVVDAFLAHCVYADNCPKAFVCTPFSRTDLECVCGRLGVVLPPAHRLYPPFFRGIGRPGEWLEIEDPRWIARVRGFARRKIRWDTLAEPAAGEKPAPAQ